MENGQASAWNRQFIVSWAEPQDEPDEETMAKVTYLIMTDHSISSQDAVLVKYFENIKSLFCGWKIADGWRVSNFQPS